MYVRISALLAAAALMCMPQAFAQTTVKNTSNATLLKIEEREPDFRYIGQPSDAPLTSGVHTYKVSVRQGCMTYVGEWDSDRPGFAQSIRPQTPVQADVHGHTLHVNYMGEDMDMALVGHKRLQSCSNNR